MHFVLHFFDFTVLMDLMTLGSSMKIGYFLLFWILNILSSYLGCYLFQSNHLTPISISALQVLVKKTYLQEVSLFVQIPLYAPKLMTIFSFFFLCVIKLTLLELGHFNFTFQGLAIILYFIFSILIIRMEGTYWLIVLLGSDYSANFTKWIWQVEFRGLLSFFHW